MNRFKFIRISDKVCKMLFSKYNFHFIIYKVSLLSSDYPLEFRIIYNSTDVYAKM